MKAPHGTARLTAVWVLLSAISLLSWGISTAVHGNAPADPSLVVTCGVLVIALVKARLILRHFLEVSTAPAWLRRGTDAWLLALWSSILVIYLA